ncbi:MAG: CDP-alcohol phosphatidyltransferase family protein, partial [Phycicoccus sp.]|nr:CDP-alcohol phosphatidyltransferase family protein [Phycicoccus sp.]
RDDVPLVVAAADLSISVPAVLDLLDKPGVTTGVAVVHSGSVNRGIQHLPAVRIGMDGKLVESVGTASHVVTGPNRALPGLLRVAAAHRSAAAAAWQEAATVAHPDDDPFALAVLALVRSGIPVQAVPLGPFAFSRGDSSADGAVGGPWQQRLRGASRGGDGFFSTYAVRPLSRKVTGLGLRLGWSPNAVTAASVALGVLAAGLVATGSRGLWVVASVLVQVSLVIDCVDGEIARFTRRFSAFGAWLDAVGDRVKEYSVFAALAVVGSRTGDHAWTLAIVAMAVVTVRHLEDYAYEHRLRPLRLSRPDVLPLDQERDLGPEQDRITFEPPPSRRQTMIHWVKKVIHMPIAERYLLISLGLLTGNPRVVLWLLIITVSLSVIWTQGGRTVKALTRRDGVLPARPDAGWGHLDVQLDLGPVARLAGHVMRLPFLAACLALVLLTTSAVVMIVQHRTPVAFLVVLLGALVIGAGARQPVADVMDWQLPAFLWFVEAAVIATVGWVHLDAAGQGLAFAFLAAVAYHRYDVVYRLRDTGEPAAAWLPLAGLGVDGRLLSVLAVAAWAPDALPAVLVVGTMWLTVLYLAESTAGWRRWIVAQRPDPAKPPAFAPGISE